MNKDPSAGWGGRAADGACRRPERRGLRRHVGRPRQDERFGEGSRTMSNGTGGSGGAAPASGVGREAADGVGRREWLTLVVLTFSVFMILVDSTVVNVAIPAIIGDLGATPVVASS